MNLLAFDTSTECLSVAVSRNRGARKKTIEVRHVGALEHAERIIPLIEKALGRAGLELAHCDAFLIGAGPGSFTGLRVGFGTLQGFRLGTGKPCYAVPSLDVVAEGCCAHEGLIAVLMDARREKVYMGVYESKKGKVKRKQRYLCARPEEAVKHLKFIGPKSLWLTGTGLSRYGTFFEKNLKDTLLAPERFWYPRARNLIKVFEDRRKKPMPLEVSRLVPLYLQEPHIGPVKI